MLWATQGVHEVVNAYHRTGKITKKTVPSAGARHAFETYIVVLNVKSLTPGIYLYRSLTNELVYLKGDSNLSSKIVRAYEGEKYQDGAQWLGKSSVVFCWSCVPYQGEWRYDREAHRLMLLDVGHVCQNLYLAAESILCGTCAIAAYDQDYIDSMLGLDGNDEYIVYFAPVGKL